MAQGNTAKPNFESGCQVLARLCHCPSLSNLDTMLFPDIKQGEVIEVCGRAGSGKTEMLYHLAAHCILPSKWGDDVMGGMDIGVLFIDTDYHFSLKRLVCILERRILNIASSVIRPLIANIVRHCLERLYVVQCNSSEQLLVTMHSLETMLQPNMGIAVVMIDSISAYYWWDRMNYHRFRDLDKYHSNLIGCLDRIVRTNDLIVVATKQALMKSADADGIQDIANNQDSREAYDFMGRHWQRFVTCRLFLSKESSGIVVRKTKKDGQEVKQARITDEGIVFCDSTQT